MLKNYLKIALRNLWKNRIFTGVNVIGIAFSMAAFVLILEYIGFERNVNQFHTNLPSIYRVIFQTKEGKYGELSAAALGKGLKQNFAEVKTYSRILDGGTAAGIVTYSGNDSTKYLRAFKEKNMIYADADFFKIFSFPIIEGTISLAQPNTIAISRSQAQKYFGSEKAMGKILTLNNQFGKTPYTVSAIFEDVPENSDLQFDLVFSLETLANPANLDGNDWAKMDGSDTAFMTTFVQLQSQTSSSELENKIDAWTAKMFPASTVSTHLQAMQNLHLAKGLNDPYPVQGNLRFVYLLGSIGLLILIIAWLNYINLSTASSLKRAKEVGVRKVVGANRGQLLWQFLGESLMINLLGLMAGILLVIIFQEPFNWLINKHLSIENLLQNTTWLAGFAFLLTGLVASGGYVAAVLSSFPVAETLKGSFGKSLKGVFLRKSLVVFQFTISVVLIISTLILYRQLTFMQHKSLGVNLEQLLVIKGPEMGSGKEQKQGSLAFRNELAQRSYIKNFSLSGSVPGNSYNYSTQGVTRLNPNPKDEKKEYNVTFIDDNFLKTFGISLAIGENFTSQQCEKGYQGDKLMLNEKAVKEIGFASSQEALGKRIKFDKKDWEIVGIIKDYHHQSLKSFIEPVVFIPMYNRNYFTIRLITDKIHDKVAELESLYKQNFAGNPFEYFFADENYDKQYQTEKQYGLLFVIASSLAIFISCLGLFGLATFSVEQKTKEIGIRKVLGASVSQIVGLLSTEFLKLVLISFVVATPIAWWAMNKWLQDFAYKINISWWIFAAAGFLAFTIAFITVSYQSIKAALMNPVKSLKTE